MRKPTFAAYIYTTGITVVETSSRGVNFDVAALDVPDTNRALTAADLDSVFRVAGFTITGELRFLSTSSGFYLEADLIKLS